MIHTTQSEWDLRSDVGAALLLVLAMIAVHEAGHFLVWVFLGYGASCSLVIGSFGIGILCPTPDMGLHALARAGGLLVVAPSLLLWRRVGGCAHIVLAYSVAYSMFELLSFLVLVAGGGW